MKKIIPLSLLAVSYLVANDLQVDTINVESTVISEVAENAQTSADVAKALSDKVPSIDMNRRSGIANDIYIRGQKRDNIVVEVDGTKVCGACPNRMDPPTSHIVANQVDKITVIEGPYDVESFGVLSGGVKIETKKPTKDLKGSINLGFGAWNYRKFGATVSGGNDFIRMIATVSDESSDQYKDGNGDTLAEQVDNYGTSTYLPQYHDTLAYKKKSAMAKAYISTFENQELRLSVTANRSDNILYPSSKMDAKYDDSNIYSAEYNIDSINDNFTNLNLQYYHSDVDHPMDTRFRTTTPMYMTNHLKTNMDGLKLKNTFDITGHELLLGLDTSKRTWEGEYYRTSTITGVDTPHTYPVSIPKTETENAAIFAKLKKAYGDFNVELGARYDNTKITNNGGYTNNDYSGFNANVITTYNINKENKIFAGFGQAYRVPDARELYFISSMTGNLVGSETLEQTKNQEVDLGYETDNQYFKLKAKAFYSMLDNYIYYQKQINGTAIMMNNFKNINASIYGAELSASIYATDDITIDMGASYKVGKKDEALIGQTDTDLADIAPLRGNIAVNYEYINNSMATLEVQASDRWDKIDSDNGEQEIAGWAVVNAKVKHAVNKKFDLTIGLNNIFDVTYAVNNTYADLTLLTGGATDIMILNEPGRYFYTNLDFKF
ncbi:TonB-dependent receptor domain-containing protein [Sulfurimonas microaerophilic]|uniref:TonB-dependent receptor domain-containing protein n=1 Tax=Sulfurimonas microaerophilic TaxID=3058392 RepID=UPI0027152287|nr:TonB-dependent receptor [Sulfurimonas sp. hsl 1-7]